MSGFSRGRTIRCLALDLGDKRTGLATGDAGAGVASPLRLIEQPMREGPAGDALVREIVRTIEAERPARLVVGLPLNMEGGDEGPQAKKVRAFAQRVLEAALAKTGEAPELVFHDERLTSAQADWQMAQSGLTHKQKKARRDALAAAAILRDYFASLREGHGP